MKCFRLKFLWKKQRFVAPFPMITMIAHVRHARWESDFSNTPLWAIERNLTASAIVHAKGRLPAAFAILLLSTIAASLNPFQEVAHSLVCGEDVQVELLRIDPSFPSQGLVEGQCSGVLASSWCTSAKPEHGARTCGLAQVLARGSLTIKFWNPQLL